MTHDDIVPALEIYGKSDGYGANYCHSMIRIRAHRGHEIECQMVSNEAIWLFRCVNYWPIPLPSACRGINLKVPATGMEHLFIPQSAGMPDIMALSRALRCARCCSYPI